MFKYGWYNRVNIFLVRGTPLNCEQRLMCQMSLSLPECKPHCLLNGFCLSGSASAQFLDSFQLLASFSSSAVPWLQLLSGCCPCCKTSKVPCVGWKNGQWKSKRTDCLDVFACGSFAVVNAVVKFHADIFLTL